MADVTKKPDVEAEDSAPVIRRRTSPMQFLQEVRREMSKVTWPTQKETMWTTVMVFIMVGLTMVFFFMVDLVLQYGEYLLIGARRLY